MEWWENLKSFGWIVDLYLLSQFLKGHQALLDEWRGLMETEAQSNGGKRACSLVGRK
jgi:hypothetical protein